MLDSLQVISESTTQFHQGDRSRAAAYGQVCCFIAIASEKGMSVKLGILKAYASSA
jgi:hypothetical protein